MRFTDDDRDDDRRGGAAGFDMRYWLWVLRRRFWLAAIVATVIAGAGLSVALLAPPVYEARATLLVESQQIPTELVRSTVGTPAAEQIEVIKQRLLTRETLMDLAATHGLFDGAPDLPTSTRVRLLREAIGFSHQTLGPGGGPSGTVATAFTVTFRTGDAVKSAAVVSDLVTRILRQSAELRQARARTTSDFFRQEVERLSDDLGRTEARIVAFQKANEQALPQSLDYRRDQLMLLQERLQRFELQHIDLEQERAAIQIALDAEDAALDGPLSENARELAELRRMMVQRRAILAESHPDIRALASRIRALEAVMATNAEESAAAAVTAPPPTDPARREMRRRLGLIDARLAFTDEVVTALSQERDALAQSLRDTPNVEMALNGLRRAHETLELGYRAARAKLADAEAGEQLEDRQQGERFEVIEPATVPERPAAPNRRAYATLGLGGGVAAALGLVVLLEMLSGVARRPEDLARIGREPIAVIPYIGTEAERRRGWVMWIFGTLVLVGAIAAGLMALHTHHLPLETVADDLLRRVGLDGAANLLRGAPR